MGRLEKSSQTSSDAKSFEQLGARGEVHMGDGMGSSEPGRVTEYILEIYEPNDTDTVWMVFRSSTPFLALAVGDLVNPSTWPDSEAPMKILRILNLEHIIWEIEGQIKHKICVYTEEVVSTKGLHLAHR